MRLYHKIMGLSVLLSNNSSPKSDEKIKNLVFTFRLSEILQRECSNRIGATRRSS